MAKTLPLRTPPAHVCRSFPFRGRKPSRMSPLGRQPEVPAVYRCNERHRRSYIATHKLFADDTSTFVCNTSLPAVEHRLQVTVSNLEAWFNTWGLSVNISKSAVIVMSTWRQSPKWINIQINGSSIPQVISHKHLGLLLNDQLKWSDHVTYIVNKPSKRLAFSVV